MSMSRAKEDTRPAIEKITMDDLKAQFQYSLPNAAKNLKVSVSMLKIICRKNGIGKWPFRQVKCSLKNLDQAVQRLQQIIQNENTRQGLSESDVISQAMPAILNNAVANLKRSADQATTSQRRDKRRKRSPPTKKAFQASGQQQEADKKPAAPPEQEKCQAQPKANNNHKDNGTASNDAELLSLQQKRMRIYRDVYGIPEIKDQPLTREEIELYNRFR
mmetsp:Transcript_15043/g.28226  ORF Transcript_15043/g.28226 Transcript_15043/m.28226 type:complete len:218 (-) Transcript_15043:133-786(-)